MFERQGHDVPDLHSVDRMSDIDDSAEVLVAENLAFLDACPAFVQMQIGSADFRRGDLDKEVGRFIDLGVGTSSTET